MAFSFVVFEVQRQDVDHEETVFPEVQCSPLFFMCVSGHFVERSPGSSPSLFPFLFPLPIVHCPSSIVRCPFLYLTPVFYSIDLSDTEELEDWRMTKECKQEEEYDRKRREN